MSEKKLQNLNTYKCPIGLSVYFLVCPVPAGSPIVVTRPRLSTLDTVRYEAWLHEIKIIHLLSRNKNAHAQVLAPRERVTCRSKVVTGTADASPATRATSVSLAKASLSTTTTSSAPSVTASNYNPLPPHPYPGFLQVFYG